MKKEKQTKKYLITAETTEEYCSKNGFFGNSYDTRTRRYSRIIEAESETLAIKKVLQDSMGEDRIIDVKILTDN